MDEQIKKAAIGLYRELLGRGLSLEIKAGGSSMWPFIHDGETLIIRKMAIDNIMRGDVIATYADERLLCHRVFRKNKNFIQTKADALVGLDAKISCEDILGRVIARRKNNRLQKWDGWMATLAGRCILWFSFLWAPTIPTLRRCKTMFNR